MTSPVYEVFLYQGNNRLSEVEYTRLEASSRFLTLGRWELTVPRLPHGLTWMTRIQVVRNGVSVFTGPLTKISRKWTYAETDSRLLIGTCDMRYIRNAIVSPIPSSPWPYTALDHDIRTGIAETVIRSYIDDNIGPSAIDSRKQGISLEADQARGLEVTGDGFIQNLLEFCVDLAIRGRVGFKVIDKTVKFFTPQDRTGEIIFSQELDNLKSFEYEANVPEYNTAVAISAPTGNGARRLEVAMANEAVESDGPVEVIIDARSASWAGGVQEVARSAVVRISEGDLNLHVIPGAQAVANMSPYDDYDIGDTVTAIIDGDVINARVQEIGILVTHDDVHEHATLGSFGNNSGTLKVGSLLKDITSRVKNLEAV